VLPFFMILIAVYIFILGSVIGSFANMLAYRVHFRKPLNGRSFCDFTGQPLDARDLLPVLSFVVYRGRCRVCRQKLPLLYPVLELIYGFSTLIVAYLCFRSGLGLLDGVYYVVGFWMLLFFGVYDLLYWKLPKNILLISLIIVIVLSNLQIAILPSSYQLIISRLTAAVILATFSWVLMKISGGAGMEKNDLLLLALLGMLTGLEWLLLTVLITLVSASVVGAVVSLRKRKLKGVSIQLAPFLYFGAFSAFVYYFLTL